MGFKVPELTAQSRAPLDKGAWDMRFKTFKHGESSQKKTPFVQAVFKVVDEDAVDTEGNAYKKDFYADTFYLTPNAMWRLKKFASEAGVELPEAGDEYDSLADFAQDLTEAFDGLEGTVEVDLESFTDKDDNERQKAVPVGYNF